MQDRIADASLSPLHSLLQWTADNAGLYRPIGLGRQCQWLTISPAQAPVVWTMDWMEYSWKCRLGFSSTDTGLLPLYQPSFYVLGTHIICWENHSLHCTSLCRLFYDSMCTKYPSPMKFVLKDCWCMHKWFREFASVLNFSTLLSSLEVREAGRYLVS